ncbi:hypothetical protein HH308_06320 [Gordonia sp. TBRC 11910]|uniref:Uncharacterized protein n=1 Tax=Gordonia asplenii TaxID=2725283 RepID=A0A848KS77_9ACTN|nr:hypothetical protein [Gordonia asplenii]NMO00827.1 hypothetical protein [Gordonia asplenii]
MDEYAVARGLLDEVTGLLPVTRAGAVELAYLHPGALMPRYSSCDTAWCLVTSIGRTSNFPQPDMSFNGPADAMVSLTLGVDRCYVRPDDNLALDVAEVDSQMRDILDDGRALRQAIQCWASKNRRSRVLVGPWTPTGPAGDVFGGQITVQVLADNVCRCDGFTSVDDGTPRLAGDPRG